LLGKPCVAKEFTLVVFGDSLSAGYGLPRGSGWVDLLAKRLADEPYRYRVVNASVSGETSLGGRSRLSNVLSQHNPSILILELGANDGLRGQPVEQLAAHLGAMIRACKAAGTRVLLIGMRIPPNYGRSYTQAFAQTFPRIAKQHGLPLVPFLLEGFAQHRSMFQDDGFHPNADAQPIMLATVWKVLEPMLR